MHPELAVAPASFPEPSVRVLGELELRGAGGPVVLPRRKARQILVTLLAYPNQFVARDALVDSLWPDDLPTDPLASTRSYVSMVRRALESAWWPGEAPQVVSQPGGITLSIDEDALDSTRFARLAGRADAASTRGAFGEALELLDAALALVRGTPLEDACASPLVAPETHRLRAVELRARELRLTAQLALGRHADVIEGARSLLADHPYQEGLWSIYAQGLAASGDRAAAAAAIDEVRAQLSEHFGVELSRHLAELDAVLRTDREVRPSGGEAAPPAPVARKASPPDPCIPLAATSLVGREGELLSLRQLVESQRLVSLVGQGGVGKTRLAAEVVKASPATRVPCWCALDEATNLEEVITSIGTATAAHDAMAHRTLEHLAGAIGDKEVLLVLDTCERVRAAVATVVAELLAACPNLSVLATSRQPLHLAEEEVFDVAPLPFPARRPGLQVRRPGADPTGSEPVMDPATELLWHRYLEAGGSESLTLSEATQLGRLAALVEGLPLALELLAHRLAAEGLEVPVDVAAGVVDLEAFEGYAPLGTGPARHASLRRAIDWSYSALSGDEQSALEILSPFAEPFAFTSASAALEAWQREPSAHVGVLAQLADRSMLQVTHLGEGSWFRMTDVVRSFVIERSRVEPVVAGRVHVAHVGWRRRQHCPLQSQVCTSARTCRCDG